MTGGAFLAVGISLATLASTQARGPDFVAAVAEPLLDAVVNISTSQTMKGPQGVPLPKAPKGSPFDEFFEDFFNKKGKPGAGPDRKVSSLGSGFVIDPSGLVVTNHHVIEGADEIVINFPNGTKLKVDKVLGKDTKTDLALLKVTPKKPLPFVKFGDSSKMRVGDWVMAIGNPFGLGGSLTVGVVSAKQRDINSGPYDEYIQTDAAINKGNSGGPLFNMSGEVIGVNTAIISPTGGSIGIGFAVPSDTAINVVDQLQKFGETHRGWLGVKIQSVSDEIAESLDLKDQKGALIAGLTEGGPAAKAGILREDVVIKFDGKEVNTSRALPRFVAQTPVDKTVEVEVLRKGQRKTFQVKVGRLEEDDAVKKAKAVVGDPGKGEPAGQGSLAGRPQADALDRRAAPEVRHRQEGAGRRRPRGRSGQPRRAEEHQGRRHHRRGDAGAGDIDRSDREKGRRDPQGGPQGAAARRAGCQRRLPVRGLAVELMAFGLVVHLPMARPLLTERSRF